MPHPTSFLHNGPINSPELHSPCAVIDCFAILSSIFSSFCNWLFKHLHAHIDTYLMVYKTNFHTIIMIMMLIKNCTFRILQMVYNVVIYIKEPRVQSESVSSQWKDV